METPITLGGLLSVVKSDKPMTINLYNADTELLIISFELKGYAALEDRLEQSEITEISIMSLNRIDIKINEQA